MQLIDLLAGGDRPEYEFDVHRVWHLPGDWLAVHTGYDIGPRELLVWDLAAGRPVTRTDTITDEEHDCCYQDTALSPDGSTFAFGDQVLRLADPGRKLAAVREPGEPIYEPFGGLAFGPAGDVLYRLQEDGGRIDRWDLAAAFAAGDEEALCRPDPLTGVDGRGSAVSPAGDLLVATAGRELRRWRLPDESPLPPLLLPEPDAGNLGVTIRFSPDGRSLAVARGREVLLCDPAAAAPRAVRRVEPHGPIDLAFTPDGGRLLLVLLDGTVLTLDAADGSDAGRLALGDQLGRLAAVSVAADGLTAVAGGTGYRLVRWDL